MGPDPDDLDDLMRRTKEMMDLNLDTWWVDFDSQRKRWDSDGIISETDSLSWRGCENDHCWLFPKTGILVCSPPKLQVWVNKAYVQKR